VQLHFGEHAPGLDVGRLLRELLLERSDLRVEDALEAPERDDAGPRLARENLVAARFRLLGELLPQDARVLVALGAFERGSELLLEGDALGIELDRLAIRSERVLDHVVLEVHVTERSERARTRRHRRENASPRLHRELRVAVLEVTIAEIDEVSGVVRPDRRQTCQHFQRALVFTDAAVEIRQAREHLFVALPARLELGQELERARAIASLHERFALLEHELRIVRCRADERFVFGDRLVDLALGLQHADHLEPQIDVLRVDRERPRVRLERACAVARLFVKRAEEGEPREVRRVLVFDLFDEHGQLLIGAIDLGDGFVDLRAHGRFLPGGREGLLESGDGFLVLVRLRLGLPEIFQRRSERAVVACRGGDQIFELRFGLVVLGALEKLASELALHEQALRIELHELVVERLRACVILRVEREHHERAHALLFVGRHRLQCERFFVTLARAGDVAAVLEEPRQGEQRDGVAILQADRFFVGLDRVVGPPVRLVDAGERHGRGVLLGSRL
jgi:hypothetical protein